jgi:transposase-like protein
MRTRRSRPTPIVRSAFAGFCFPIEADHGRLKARLRQTRGFKQDHSARVLIAGHAFVQNVRRGHYALAVEARANRRVAAAFDELALAI